MRRKLQTGKVDTAGGGNRRWAVKVAARTARAAAAISGVVSAASATISSIGGTSVAWVA